ncbi:MAG: cobalamin biosynthesis protein [Desulfovibrio sp.]|jgi:adenosylcobinamide-phosphate synthase|nr:cobalamin biosynthesis protein [Desulfovibrio sp.]
MATDSSISFFRPDCCLWWLPPLALLLDILLADPQCLPHPVQGIAFLGACLEKPARATKRLVSAGTFAMFLLLLLTVGITTVFINLPYGFGKLAALYLSWSGLALGGLIREGSTALRLIERAKKDAAVLPQARKAVQMLVSRDTGEMDDAALCRSLAESVSENINDALVAPFFWLLLTGPVGLWAYKCVSTMDSMWGYTNERWILLGRAAARLDDILAWIPARLTALLMFIVAWISHILLLFLSLFRHAGATKTSTDESFHTPSYTRIYAGTFRLPNWPGWSLVILQARLSASPNAGWPMAVAAWLFNGRNGGETIYHGMSVQKPFMGPEQGCWTIERTSALIRHACFTGMLAGILGTAVFWTVLALSG